MPQEGASAAPRDRSLPLLSVVIPTFNRAADLRRCLDALAGQTADPGAFEVVVVDDGSRDATPQVLAEYGERLPLRSFRQPNRGPSAARNRGIAEAEGDWCLFMDDDIRADPGLVASHVQAQQATGGVVGIGHLGLRMRSRGGLARHFAAWWDEHYRRLEVGEAEPAFWDCFTGNLSAPTDALRSIGGFDEDLRRNEDIELGYRLLKSGTQIRYLADARAQQQHPKGFTELVRDFDAAGAAAPALWRKHPELVENPQLGIGAFSQGSNRSVLMRRLLLAVRAPVWPLGLLDRLLSRRPPEALYRLLQFYCFWRGFRAALDDRETWRRLTRGPVILMYHAVARNERASRYVIPEGRLRRQLAWLRLRRRPVLSLDEYTAHRAQHRLPPARSVVITFDDGYADAVEVAGPMLRSRELKATMFLVADRVGDVNRWDHEGPTAGRRLLSWEQARELIAMGMEIGAHTRTHPRLPGLDEADAEREIAGSRERLEAELGAPVRHFSYPYGELTPELEALVGRSGFASACGVVPGVNDPTVPLSRLFRIEVEGTSSLARFAWELWLGGRTP